jgi:hypothetical protein
MKPHPQVPQTSQAVVGGWVMSTGSDGPNELTCARYTAVALGARVFNVMAP